MSLIGTQKWVTEVSSFWVFLTVFFIMNKVTTLTQTFVPPLSFYCIYTLQNKLYKFAASPKTILSWKTSNSKWWPDKVQWKELQVSKLARWMVSVLQKSVNIWPQLSLHVASILYTVGWVPVLYRAPPIAAGFQWNETEKSCVHVNICI